MKIVSLKTAKELREAGYPQKTYWFWCLSDDPELIHFDYHDTARVNDFRTGSTKSDKREYIYASAPTAEEILDILPCRIWIDGVYYEITLFKADKYWHEDGSSDDKLTYGFSYEAYKDGVIHCLDIGVYGNHVSSDESMAEAAGEIWLQLKKKNYLT